MPTRVTLREVSLREGRQCFGHPMPTAFQCDWILIAYAAGLRHIAIDVCSSFDPLHRTDATLEVVAFAATLPDLQVCATVTDAESARRALDHGASVVTVPLASGNSRAGLSEGRYLEELRGVCRTRDTLNAAALVEARIAMPLSGPDGELGEAHMRPLVRAALHAGCDVIGLADTCGRVAPEQVLHVFGEVCAMAGSTPVAAHLRDGRNFGLASVRAALHAGATLLDVTLACGGQGNPADDGPFAVPAMLDAQGVDTGVDLRALRGLRDFAARHATPSPHS